MENPFESGHIKNYIYLYTSVVVIMVLFFIASTLFHDVVVPKTKVFETKTVDLQQIRIENKENSKDINSTVFKLMPKVY